MAFQIPTDLHPDLMPVSWLLGTWHGNGKGEYPTIEPYAFEQEAVFAHDGRAFLHYFSRTWVTDDSGERVGPGELETGFLRVGGENPAEADGAPDAGGHQVEMVLAHPAGYAEVWYGVIDGPRLTLATDVVARTSTAKDYTAGQRMYGLVEGDLMYAYDMAAMDQPMQSHAWGRLARV
jgi:hypothetical protein